MDVIDLNAEREKRDGPDPQFVIEQDGGKWYNYCASYRDGNSEFSIAFWATDMDDARRRVALIRQNLKLDGQLYHAEDA